jgi:hypothetical protein
VTTLVANGSMSGPPWVDVEESSWTFTTYVDLPENSGVVLVFLTSTNNVGFRYKDLQFECEEAAITGVFHSYDGGEYGTDNMVHVVGIALPDGYTGTLTVNVTCAWWDSCVPFVIYVAARYYAFTDVRAQSFGFPAAVLQDFEGVHTTDVPVLNEGGSGLAMWVAAAFGTQLSYSGDVTQQDSFWALFFGARTAVAPLAAVGDEVTATVTEDNNFSQMLFAAGFPLYSADPPPPPAEHFQFRGFADSYFPELTAAPRVDLREGVGTGCPPYTPRASGGSMIRSVPSRTKP